MKPNSLNFAQTLLPENRTVTADAFEEVFVQWLVVRYNVQPTITSNGNTRHWLLELAGKQSEFYVNSRSCDDENIDSTMDEEWLLRILEPESGFLSNEVATLFASESWELHEIEKEMMQVQFKASALLSDSVLFARSLPEQPKIMFDYVCINGGGWNLFEEKNQPDMAHRIWTNDAGDEAGLFYYDKVPDLSAPPTVENIDILRQMYRDMVAGVNAGIVHIESIQLAGIPALETIIKAPQQPTGMTYVASITLPFARMSYVVKYICPEHGTTGIRDSLVLGQRLHDDSVSSENVFDGWQRDPYESAFDKEALYNQSDQEKYDRLFPDHPLCLARYYLRLLKATIKLHPELQREPLFTHPPASA